MKETSTSCTSNDNDTAISFSDNDQRQQHEDEENRHPRPYPQLQKSTTPYHASVYTALLAPERVKALEICDSNLISYNVTSFLIIFTCRGRHFEMIAAPLLCLLLWDIGWALYMVHLQHEAFPVRSQIQKMESLITPLLTPVSFLLVFRLGRAAVRYWDARAALGKVVEICRSMSSTALVGCQSFSATCSPTGIDNTHQQQRLTQNQQKQQQLAEDFVRWIAVFPIAVKNFLRPHEGLGCKRQQEIGNVLCPEDCKGLLDAKADYQYAPIFVLNRMRQLAFEVCHPSLLEQQQQRKQQPPTNDAVLAMLYRQLNEQIDTLTGAWGAMERISGTPLPFVYVVHLRTFILLYLCLWHLEAIASKGWIALLPLMLASWGLLGIEAAAVECERPFQWQSNHLALGKACLIVSRNLAQTMQNTGWATNTNLTNKGN